MTTSMNEVRGFFEQDRIAVVGVSARGRGFGAAAYKELKAQGLQLVPIHPEAEEIDGTRAYPTLRDLPEPAASALIVVPPEQTEQVVEDAIAAGVQYVWMQQGSESERAIDRCRQAGLTVIAGECVLMFAGGSRFPHNIHRFLWKILGKLPQEQAAA